MNEKHLAIFTYHFPKKHFPELGGEYHYGNFKAETTEAASNVQNA